MCFTSQINYSSLYCVFWAITPLIFRCPSNTLLIYIIITVRYIWTRAMTELLDVVQMCILLIGSSFSYSILQAILSNGNSDTREHAGCWPTCDWTQPRFTIPQGETSGPFAYPSFNLTDKSRWFHIHKLYYRGYSNSLKWYREGRDNTKQA